MKCILVAATTAALVSLSASTFACGQSADRSNQDSEQNQSQASGRHQTSEKESQGQNAQAPKGFIMLEENTVYMMAREPQQHLLRAHEQLDANNPKAAAAELRLAGAYLKMQEARPGNQAQGVLNHWQQQLDQLAGRVEKGEVKAQDLIHAANGTNYALAKYFDQRAKDELGQHQRVQAGYDLQAAADCFEQSLLWSKPPGEQGGQTPASNQQNRNERNSQIGPQETQALGEARTAADQLISADNLASNQSGNGEAQLAAGRIAPGNQQQQGSSNASSGNGMTSQNAQKAADELGKAINSVGSQFQSQANQNDPEGSSSSANSKSK